MKRSVRSPFKQTLYGIDPVSERKKVPPVCMLMPYHTSTDSVSAGKVLVTPASAVSVVRSLDQHDDTTIEILEVRPDSYNSAERGDLDAVVQPISTSKKPVPSSQGLEYFLRKPLHDPFTFLGTENRYYHNGFVI